MQNEQVSDKQFIETIERNIAWIRFNTNREVVYVNEIFASTIGYKASEMIGMKHAQLCFPEFTNSSEYEKFWKELLSGKNFQDKIDRKNSRGEKNLVRSNVYANFFGR